MARLSHPPRLPRLSHPPRLTFPELWAGLAILLPVLGSLLAPISTVDLAYHVRAGGIVLDSGALPSPDTFTWSAAGRPWLDQQWAAQVALAALYRAGGWALVSVTRAALVGLIAWLVLRACRSAGVALRVAAWLTLGGFLVSLAALAMRPQLFGMVLFAAILAVLGERGRHPRLLWAIPSLVVLWANVHGSFVLGPAALGAAWLFDVVNRRPTARRLFVLGVVSGLATLVNPYGGGVWTYAVGLSANPVIRRLVSEWQPTTPLSFGGAMFYGSVVAIVAGLIIAVVTARRRVAGRYTSSGTIDPAAAAADPTPDAAATAADPRRPWPTLAWLLGLGLIGAFAERGVAWWAIAAPVALAGLLRPPLADRRAAASIGAPRERPSATNTAIVVALGLLAVLLLPTWRGGDTLYGPPGLLTDAPRGITTAVTSIARPTDRIWNAQRWGSWLEFALPGVPVAVDSRIELIPAEVWSDHLALSAGAPDWAAILDRRRITIVVAAASEQRALLPLLRASPTWRLVHEDTDGAVFARR